MVINTPDPPNQEQAVLENENIQISMTDSEDDDAAYDGYEMLPTDNDVEDFGMLSDDEITDTLAQQSSHQQLRLSSTHETTTSDPKDIGTTPQQKEKSVEEPMDQDLKDEVLKVMKNFTLPASSIPQWANDVREEDWKRHLLEKIRDKP